MAYVSSSYLLRDVKIDLFQMNNTNQILLAIQNLKLKGFAANESPAFSFSIENGEHWAIMGESGSGKTQFLEFISGRIALVNQAISYPALEAIVNEKQEIDPLFNWHKLCAYVPFRHQFKNKSNTSSFYYQQRYNASDSSDAATVNEYLSAISNMHPESRWGLAVLKTALTIDVLWEKEVIKLSNGETRRVLLAAALLKDPEILLLDNPFMGLDSPMRATLENFLSIVSSSGIHLVMVHSAKTLPSFINKVAWFEHGAIVSQQDRDTFLTSDYLRDEQITIEENQLQQLLAASPIPSFDDVIKMNNVVVDYSGKVVLSGINWHVKTGECWALQGENGAGKSTLLSLVNGDNPKAYANDITLFDRKRGTGESIWDIKKNIGFISPELFQCFPRTSSCLQVIESGFYDTLGLFRTSHPAKRETALKWLKVIKMEHLGNRLFRNVSAGEQRLCLMARAMVKNPALLIFDEPCQGLDSKQQALFRYIVNFICKETKVAIIYVSHYKEEIPDGISRLIRLHKGVVVEMK